MDFLKKTTFTCFATIDVYGAGAQIATNISDIDTLEAEPNVEIDDTGAVGSPNILTGAETRKVLINEATLAATNYHTLPTAVADLEFTFVCNHANGIRIVANTDDTIRLGASITIATGYIESAVVGSTVTLVAISAVEWIAVNFSGSWDVNTS